MTRHNPAYYDTIAAIATPPGHGGIAIIRMSGPRSAKYAGLIFRSEHESRFTESYRLYHGHIVDPRTNDIIDEVLCVYMRSPGSYTGEDVIEIHSHGGYVVPKKILETLFTLGARPARAGEFSLRAFLNGKMDLTQAEAVCDIINASTEVGLKQAELQLKGELSRRIGQFKDTIIDILAEIEAHVDFPEEEIDSIAKDSILKRVKDTISGIESLIDTYEEGRILKQGVKTAILGRPNVGKSSLLNAMLMKERAIVSPLPGTTRDFIEESMSVRGIPLILTDTAGIRRTSDEIEHFGVRLAKEKANEAELVLIVLDGSEELHGEDIEVLKASAEKKAVIIINKSDLGIKLRPDTLPSTIRRDCIVETSAKLGGGIEELKDTISRLLTVEIVYTDGCETILTELRHKIALETSVQRLRSFLHMIETDESPEFLAIDLRSALDSTGEITGEVTNEDILGRIFSKFCIGK